MITSLFDRVVEKLRGMAKVIVQLSQALCAEALQHEPQLEDIGATRALKASNSLIDDSRRLAGVEEIWRLLGERALQITLVARQYHPGCERQEHHLVWIPGQ